MLKTLYCSLILPHLQYCALIWANTYPSRIYKLKILQKKVIRTVTKSDYMAHTNNLFKRNNLWKLDNIYKCQLGVFMYKFSNHMLSANMVTIFCRNSEVRSHNTKKYIDYYIPQTRTNINKFSVTYMGPLFWNFLSSDIKLSISKHSFKHNIIELLLSS